MAVSTKELEQVPGDFVKLSRKEFSDRAEVQAAAWRNNLIQTLKAGVVRSSDSTAVQQLAMQQFLSEKEVKVGDLLDGVVTSLHSYGAFIDVGNGAQALLPFSQITGMHLKYLADALSVGDELRALVIKVDAARSRITLSTKELERKPGDFLTLSRQEFSDRAEAGAWLDRTIVHTHDAARRRAVQRLLSEKQLNAGCLQRQCWAHAAPVRTRRPVVIAAGASSSNSSSNAGAGKPANRKANNSSSTTSSSSSTNSSGRKPASRKPGVSFIVRDAAQQQAYRQWLAGKKTTNTSSSSSSSTRSSDARPASREAPVRSGTAAARQAATQRNKLPARPRRKLFSEQQLCWQPGATDEAETLDSLLSEIRWRRSEWRVTPEVIEHGRKIIDLTRRERLKRLSRNERAVRQLLLKKKIVVGDVLVGVVKFIKDYGAFIDVGRGVTGLLHRDFLSKEPIASPSQVLAVGDKLKVFVLDVDKWEGQITLATSVLEQEAGDFVRLSRKEFNDRAEEPAAALRERWRSSEAMQKVFAEYPVGDLQLDMR